MKNDLERLKNMGNPREHFNADGSRRPQGTGGYTTSPSNFLYTNTTGVITTAGKNEIGGFVTELPSPSELTQKDIIVGG